MTRSHGSLWALVCCLPLACAGAPTPTAPPASEPAPTAAPEPEPAPSAAEPAAAETAAAEPEPAPAPEPPARPKSAATIGGVSISEITSAALVEELRKLGWAPPDTAVGGGTVGKYENLEIGISNGTLAGLVEIIRPAASPTGGSASMMAPKDQKGMKEGRGAVYFDESTEVLVVVTLAGKPAEAKKLLEKLIKKN